MVAFTNCLLSPVLNVLCTMLRQDGLPLFSSVYILDKGFWIPIVVFFIIFIPLVVATTIFSMAMQWPLCSGYGSMLHSLSLKVSIFNNRTIRLLCVDIEQMKLTKTLQRSNNSKAAQYLDAQEIFGCSYLLLCFVKTQAQYLSILVYLSETNTQNIDCFVNLDVWWSNRSWWYAYQSKH